MIPERVFDSADEMLDHYKRVRTRLGLSTLAVQPAPAPEPAPPAVVVEPVSNESAAPEKSQTAREIIARVAADYELTAAILYSYQRDAVTAKARLEAIGAVYSAYPDKPVRWIAEQFKRDSSTIHVALQRLGLKPPISRGAGKSTPVGGRYLLRLTPSQVHEAAELYERGHSCRRIGALYGLSYRTVCDALKRHGVAMRLPASEARHAA